MLDFIQTYFDTVGAFGITVAINVFLLLPFGIVITLLVYCAIQILKSPLRRWGRK